MQTFEELCAKHLNVDKEAIKRANGMVSCNVTFGHMTVNIAATENELKNNTGDALKYLILGRYANAANYAAALFDESQFTRGEALRLIDELASALNITGE